MPDPGGEDLPVTEKQWFETTHWSVVLGAGAESSPRASEHLEQLCRTYWYPLYAFLRRKGYGAHEAEDLTQGFFARFVEKRYLDDVQRERGKFRTFLLCSLDHFVANEWDKSQRLKRGGGMTLLPLDTAGAEGRFNRETDDQEGPEVAFDRRWAETLLDVVLRRLRGEYEQAGKDARFAELKAFLLGDPMADHYLAVALRLHMNEQAVKSAVFRLRGRFRELVRVEIGRTVATRAEIDEELSYLVRLMTT